MSVSRDPIGPYHDHLALLHDQLRIAQIAMYRQNRKVIIALEVLRIEALPIRVVVPIPRHGRLHAGVQDLGHLDIHLNPAVAERA